MGSYQLHFREKKEIARETMAFYFEKPEGFSFHAGQNFDFFLGEITDKTNTRGVKHTFSMAASPLDPEVVIATRMRDSEFKHKLNAFESGSTIRCEGPYGSMLLHNDLTRPAVFLVGGIGITPFRSMIRWSTTKQTDHRLILFYSNKTTQDAAFHDELESLAQKNKQLTYVPTLTDQQQDSDWKGERGRITQELIQKHLDAQHIEAAECIYYMAGPVDMVKAMRELLMQMGISTDHMKQEIFTGYEKK